MRAIMARSPCAASGRSHGFPPRQDFHPALEQGTQAAFVMEFDIAALGRAGEQDAAANSTALVGCERG